MTHFKGDHPEQIEGRLDYIKAHCRKFRTISSMVNILGVDLTYICFGFGDEETFMDGLKDTVWRVDGYPLPYMIVKIFLGGKKR